MQQSKDLEQALDAHFHGLDESRRLFDALIQRIDALEGVEMRVTRSQIAFSRGRGFAWAWIPEKHLKRKAAPLVLSVALPLRDPSTRWKEIVEPYPGRVMHHLELYSPSDLDAAVDGWLLQAWNWAAEKAH